MHPAGKGLVLHLWAALLLFLTKASASEAPPVNWATLIDAPNGVSHPKLIAEPSGGFYMFSDGERPLIKFAPDRSIAWEIKRVPGSNDLAGVTALDLLPNGDTIGLFSIYSPQATGYLFGHPVRGQGSLSVVALTPQGELRWMHTFTNGWAYAIAATADGGYALSGHGIGILNVGDAQIDCGPGAIYLAHFGTSLNWSLLGRAPATLEFSVITAIQADENGDLFFAGETEPGAWSLGATNLTGPGVFVGRVSPSGNLRWAQIIPNSRKFRGLDLKEHVVLAWSDATRQEFVGEFSMEGAAGWKTAIDREINGLNAGLIITVTGLEGTPGNWFLQTLDHNGNTIWRKGEPGRSASVGSSAIELADGHLIFAGVAPQNGIFLDNLFLANFSAPGFDLSQAFLASVNATAMTPQFRTHPISQKALLGETVTLQSEVYSPVPVTFRWHKNNQLFSGENTAALQLPAFQVTDAGDYLLIAENEFGSSTSRVARVEITTVAISALASSGLNAPKHPAILRDNSIVVADSSNHVVRRINLNGVSTYAGQNSSGLASGAPLNSLFSNPAALAFQPYSFDGPILYLADRGNNGIRIITVNSASGDAQTVSPPNGASVLQRPTSVATHDGLRYVVVSEENGTRLWKMQDGDVTLIAGSDLGFIDGPAPEAKFGAISAVAMDARANIYVADKGNHAIRKIDLRGNVTTIAGTNSAGFQDGLGIEARFNQPSGLAVDADGNIYLTEIGNNSIRKISPAGNVTTLTDALNKPEGLAIHADGSLVIADTGNNEIKELRFTPLFEDGPRISITLQDGLHIQVAGPAGEYWIESTDQLPPATDWQFESALTIFDVPVTQPLFAPDSSRFYRARRVN